MSLSAIDYLKMVQDAVDERMSAFDSAMKGKLKAETDALASKIAEWDKRSKLDAATKQLATDTAALEQQKVDYQRWADSLLASLNEREKAVSAREKDVIDAAAKNVAEANALAKDRREAEIQQKAAMDGVAQRSADLDVKQADLGRREAAIAAREQAVSEREQKVKSALAQIA